MDVVLSQNDPNFISTAITLNAADGTSASPTATNTSLSLAALDDNFGLDSFLTNYGVPRS
jgi:hypothetical protein